MSKKKKRTRQQKIIARLKRELEKKKSGRLGKNLPKKTKVKVPDKKTATLKAQNPPTGGTEESKESLFSYDPKLIKKSLVKTLLLSIIFITIILVLKFVFH